MDDVSELLRACRTSLLATDSPERVAPAAPITNIVAAMTSHIARDRFDELSPSLAENVDRPTLSPLNNPSLTGDGSAGCQVVYH